MKLEEGKDLTWQPARTSSHPPPMIDSRAHPALAPLYFKVAETAKKITKGHKETKNWIQITALSVDKKLVQSPHDPY